MAKAAPQHGLGFLPYIVAGCLFMENLDATVIVTALPTMAQAFGVETTTMSLGISAYMVAIAIVLPVSSWLADRVGTRTLMAGAVVGFTLASLLCGLSESLEAFVLARVGQGASAALMAPAGRLVVIRSTPKAHLVHVIAILTWPGLVAPTLGPPLGGLLTTYISWRWIFWLNLPLGLIGLLLVLRFVPQQRDVERTPFDWRGFVLIGSALGGLLLGLEMLGSGAGPLETSLIALIVGATVLALAIRHMLRTPFPLVSLAPVATPTFRVSAMTGGALTRIAIGATPFLVPLMLQTALGYNAFEAGAMTLAYFAGNLGIKPLTTWMLRTLGFKRILFFNGALVALTVAVLGLAEQMPVPVLVAILLAGGAIRSLQFTALMTLTFADIAPQQTGSANILHGLMHQLSQTTGIMIAALVLQMSSTSRGAATLTPADFATAFVTVAAIGALALIAYVRLPGDTGCEISGHGLNRV